ncbi:MAG: DM13 domain-containing protein [Chloroflexota bacterium]|nr:DM13 domain-containing protein [Chloroflexota bacterium]MDE2958922.1 DM13 domain-containing protein [Chloroflexota bacterium]
MLRYLLVGIGILIVIPVAWLAWWLLSPLFITMEVHEEFPLAHRAVVPDNMTMAEVEDAMAAAANLERPVDEAMPDSPGAAASQTEPQATLTGEFRDADAFHKGSGTATVYNLGPDAGHVLRLEDFRVTNGPDLRVLLANAPFPEGHSDLDDDGYVELDKLKGNVGSQNYDIPPDVSLADVHSVVIYCHPFRVLFSVATLEPPSG